MEREAGLRGWRVQRRPPCLRLGAPVCARACRASTRRCLTRTSTRPWTWPPCRGSRCGGGGRGVWQTRFTLSPLRAHAMPLRPPPERQGQGALPFLWQGREDQRRSRHARHPGSRVACSAACARPERAGVMTATHCAGDGAAAALQRVGARSREHRRHAKGALVIRPPPPRAPRLQGPARPSPARGRWGRAAAWRRPPRTRAASLPFPGNPSGQVVAMAHAHAAAAPPLTCSPPSRPPLPSARGFL